MVSNKIKIVMLSLAAVVAILTGTLAITTNSNQSLAQHDKAVDDTVSSLQSDNAALRSRLQQSAQAAADSSSTSNPDTSSANAASSANNHAVQGTDAENVAVQMIEKYFSYSTNTSAENQMKSVEGLITDNEKKALMTDTDGEPQKKTSAAASSRPTMTYQSECKAVHTSSHFVDTQTVYVYVIAQQTVNHSTGSGSTASACAVLASFKVVQQNGKWLVDESKTSLLQDVNAADLALK